jgi:hypothetical protein
MLKSLEHEIFAYTDQPMRGVVRPGVFMPTSAVAGKWVELLKEGSKGTRIAKSPEFLSYTEAATADPIVIFWRQCMSLLV